MSYSEFFDDDHIPPHKQSVTFRCGVKTKSGKRCRVPVTAAGQLCQHHDGRHPSERPQKHKTSDLETRAQAIAAVFSQPVGEVLP